MRSAEEGRKNCNYGALAACRHDTCSALFNLTQLCVASAHFILTSLCSKVPNYALLHWLHRGTSLDRNASCSRRTISCTLLCLYQPAVGCHPDPDKSNHIACSSTVHCHSYISKLSVATFRFSHQTYAPNSSHLNL